MLPADQSKGVTTSCPGDTARRAEVQARRIRAAVLLRTGKEQEGKDPAPSKGESQQVLLVDCG